MAAVSDVSERQLESQTFRFVVVIVVVVVVVVHHCSATV